jgi:hypothetical protein
VAGKIEDGSEGEPGSKKDPQAKNDLVKRLAEIVRTDEEAHLAELV